MKAAQHYAEAEACLKIASQASEGSAVEQYALAKAQVHATLALAGIQASITLPVSEARDGWPEVLR